MEGEYRFKQRKCSCGLILSGKASPVTSLYRNVRPMGACPKCGTQLLLDASPETSEVVLDYEPEVAEAKAPEPTPELATPRARRRR